jgi:tRNA pseudouridine55 synthase
VGNNALQNSILLIDKPVNKTSYKTIEEIKTLLKVKKIGHSGTLDKCASGLLVVCTGFATRLSRYFLESEKRYIGIIKLGITTDTLDREGEVIEERELTEIGDESILLLKERFTGEIYQIPPVYSALKIGGKRASDLIREGKDIELPERKVHVRRFDVLKIPENRSLLKIDITCSKGTYIRSIARDIGIFLGTGAYLDELRRINVGKFSVDDSVSLSELREFTEGECIDIKRRFYYSPDAALSDFGIVVVANRIRSRVLNGAFFGIEDVREIKVVEGKPYRVLDEDKNLIAIAKIEVEGWEMNYLNVFNREN